MEMLGELGVDPSKRRALFAEICSRETPAERSFVGSKKRVITATKTLKELCFHHLVNNCEVMEFGNISLPVSLQNDLLTAIVAARKLRSWHIPLLVNDSMYSLDLAWCPVTDSGLSRIPEKAPFLKKLSLRECREASTKGVCDILKGCPELRNLQMSIWRDRLDDAALETMFKPFKNHKQTEGAVKEENADLPTLKLQVLNVRDSSITDKGIRMIVDHCPDLEVLDLRWLKYAVNIDVIRYALRACKKLHSLDIGWCTAGVDDNLLSVIAEEAGDRLRQLDLEMCFNITDKGITTLTEKCTGLQYLRLKNCKRLSNVSADVIARNCKSMIALELSGCFEIDDSGVNQIARNCHDLEAASLVNVPVTIATLELLASYGKLKLLDIGASDLVEEVTEALKPKGVHLVRQDQTRQAPAFDLVCDFNIDYEKLPSIIL